MSFTMDLSDIEVKINTVLLYVDETILGVNIGNGYKVEKIRVNKEFPFYDNIIDGKGRLKIDYMSSRIIESDSSGLDSIFLFRIFKDDLFLIEPPTLQSGISYSDSTFDFKEDIEEYYEKEFNYLNNAISLLQIFKQGNIGIKEVNASFKYNVFGIINQNRNLNSSILDANIVRSDIYKLTSNETIDINNFISKHISVESPDKSSPLTERSYYVSKEFKMLSPIIDEFTFGLKQVDLPTGFEQFTTAMEMLLLEKDERGKKEVLSKRTASLLGSSNEEITTIYNSMKNYYRYRSESLHEGDGSNITMKELSELENILRECIKNYLSHCENELQLMPTMSWEEVKAKRISDLKDLVANYKASGVLPQ